MADKDRKKTSGLPGYEHWLDGVTTADQLDERVHSLVKQMREYCAKNMDAQYADMTAGRKYHGAAKHLYRTDQDDVTRMWDENGKNNHFREDMDASDLELNTMTMMDEFSDEIIRWRMLSPDYVKRLKLVMPVDDGMNQVGTGFKIGHDGLLHKWSTNAQTLILEKTHGYDSDDNKLGCRIITEYPCLETTDNLLNTINVVNKRPDHVWYNRHGGPPQQVAVKGVNPDDEVRIQVKEVKHDLDAEDVYNGVVRSDEFRRRNHDYMSAKTDADRQEIEERYEANVRHHGMQQAAPDIRGKHREVPDKFEEIYKQSQNLESSRNDPEKDV